MVFARMQHQSSKTQQLLEAIDQIDEVQHKCLLNYFCAVPRINHLLRTLPPTETRELAASHDELVLLFEDDLMFEVKVDMSFAAEGAGLV